MDGCICSVLFVRLVLIIKFVVGLFLSIPEVGDYERLVRHLCGKAVGVVLGGGGARGLAHLGVLSAMAEQGVPVDYIGGTSQGAYMAGETERA